MERCESEDEIARYKMTYAWAELADRIDGYLSLKGKTDGNAP